MSEIITAESNISTHTAREYAIDAVLAKLSDSESLSVAVIRDADVSDRFVIISEVALYVVTAHARTRSAIVTATYYGNAESVGDVLTF